MVSILDRQIELAMDDSIIDCNWYYGCLFSPKKKAEMEALLNDNGGDNTEEKHHPLGSQRPRGIVEDEKEEEGGMNGGGPCHFGSSNKDEGEWVASMFTLLDEDEDGRVSGDEIMRHLLRLGLQMPTEEVELAVRSVSACGDDFLTAMEFAEFYRILFANKEETEVEVVEEKAMCEAFNVFDQNGDGFISAMELADVLSRLGFVEGRDVECCQSMIHSVDFNGDGFVDIDEFKHLITRNASPLQCVAAIN